MALTARFECDGNGCFAEHALSGGEPFDDESIPDNWIFDEDGEFCYCPSCIERINNKNVFIECSEGHLNTDASVLGLRPLCAPTFHPTKDESAKWTAFFIDVCGENEIHGWEYYVDDQRYIVWND